MAGKVIGDALAELNLATRSVTFRERLTVREPAVINVKPKDPGRATVDPHGDGLPARAAAMIEDGTPSNLLIEVTQRTPCEIQTVVDGVVDRRADSRCAHRGSQHEQRPFFERVEKLHRFSLSFWTKTAFGTRGC